jgi:hypothetical protein
MHMRSTFASILAVLALLGMAGLAQADSVGFSDTPFNQNTNGGEFGANTTGKFTAPDWKVTLASDLTNQDGTDFHTFCVERGETLSYTPTYYYEVSKQTINTGAPLTETAAKLFYAFWADAWTDTSNLTITNPGYDYLNTVNRNADAAALQMVLWNEMSGTSYSGGKVDVYTDWAEDVSWADLGKSGWVGTGAVHVMNVWKDSSKTVAVQDQLIVVPLPGGAILGLSLLGALGFVSVIRRRRNTI